MVREFISADPLGSAHLNGGPFKIVANVRHNPLCGHHHAGVVGTANQGASLALQDSNNLKVSAQHANTAAYRVESEHQAVGNVSPNEATGQPAAKFPVGEVASTRKLQVVELGVVVGYAADFYLLHA